LQLPKFLNLNTFYVLRIMSEDPHIASEKTGWHGLNSDYFSYLEGPHEPIAHLTKRSLHRPVLLRHFKTA
jgi:hypothetical protein